MAPRLIPHPSPRVVKDTTTAQDFGPVGMDIPTTRGLLKNELVSRVVHDDANLLQNVFHIDRAPAAWVDGCCAVLQTDDMVSAIGMIAYLARNTERVEDRMYDWLCKIINVIASFEPEDATTTPALTTWIKANRRVHRSETIILHDDSVGYQNVPDRKPDFLGCEEGDDWAKKLWRLCPFLGEVKARSTFKPPRGQEREASTASMQIADASRIHLAARPFQLFSVTLCIAGTHFYVSMWDRGGGTYSPGYDIRSLDDQQVIVRIVLALSRGLSASELGQDPHVIPVEETSDRYPRFNVNSNGDIWTTQGYPIFHSLSFIGRGTTVWEVTHEKKGRRILKSAWRADDRTSEIAFYEKLNQAVGKADWPLGVARVEGGGDVTRPDDPEQSLRISSLRQGSGRQVPHDPILHRVFLKSVGRPLWEYTHPAELFAGIKDALIGHQRLFDRGFLHRDVSAGNVLLSRNKRLEKCYGFICDLELVKLFDTNPSPGAAVASETASTSTQPGQKRRKVVAQPPPLLWHRSPLNSSFGQPGAPMSGTPQFMAIELLKFWSGGIRKPPVHDAHHDLESFVWVVLYGILRHEVAKAANAVDRGDVESGGDESEDSVSSDADESEDSDASDLNEDDPEGKTSPGREGSDARDSEASKSDDDELGGDVAAEEVLEDMCAGETTKKKLARLQEGFTALFGKGTLASIKLARVGLLSGDPGTMELFPRGPLRDAVQALLDLVSDANPRGTGANKRAIKLTYNALLGALDNALRTMAHGHRGRKFLKPPA